MIRGGGKSPHGTNTFSGHAQIQTAPLDTYLRYVRLIEIFLNGRGLLLAAADLPCLYCAGCMRIARCGLPNSTPWTASLRTWRRSSIGARLRYAYAHGGSWLVVYRVISCDTSPVLVFVFNISPACHAEMLSLQQEGRDHWVPLFRLQEDIPFSVHRRGRRRHARRRLLCLLFGPQSACQFCFL